LDLHIPLSYKSRKKRDFETDGIDAYFISKEEFEKSIENKEFLEYAIVHKTDYYGTKFIDVIEN
jgi:guanylate kinase